MTITKSSSSELGLCPLLHPADAFSISPPTPEDRLLAIIDYSRQPNGTYSVAEFLAELELADLADRANGPAGKRLGAVVAELKEGEMFLGYEEMMRKVDPVRIFRRGG
mmetsp:Transcript_26684/g.66904  ORF Transcript_26684/g.66904 Transcript_26684/m.66904 type:complete len:108 (+) Transcript_26684:196-519(+)